MKKVLLVAIVGMTMLFSCDQQYSNGNGQVYVNNNSQDAYVTAQVSNLGDNLNLQALGELVKKTKNAQDLESQLNTAGSINNLDLDGDGNVDYIKVTEYGSGTTKGFSFTVELAGGQKQEVATVELQQGANNQASLNINGSQQLYGNTNNSYSSNYSMSDLLIMSYLFSPHSMYYSPYRYGYYPSYYHSYRSAPYSSYNTRVSTVTRTSTITRTTTPRTSSVRSPNQGLTSSTVNARTKALSAPTSSQRSFSRTSSSNSRPSTSGFGSSKSSSSSSRSFGSSSHSSGGSFHSSGGRRSDVRFKKNISPLTNSLDKVCLLQGVTYDWKVNEFPAEHFENKKQIGFIAQDIEKIYPSLVSTRPDGYKTVDYQMLVPALVEAIKELQNITEKQELLIKNLSSQINTSASVKK